MPAPLALSLALLSLATSASPATPGEDGGRGASVSFGGGYALYQQQVERGRAGAGGVALTLRVEDEIAPQVDFALTFTWGLTDWARAKEYIHAGNRAGQWTTDSFADVERWATTDSPKDQQALRLMGAFFADVFLLVSYIAVPACYVASPAGATSHLQLDVTGTYRLGDGPTFAFVELGAGVASLPYQVVDWRHAFGPVAGLGMQLGGKVRVGMRALWSPPGMNDVPLGGGALLGAVTLSTAR